MKHAWISKFAAPILIASLVASQGVAQTRKGKKGKATPAASASAEPAASVSAPPPEQPPPSIPPLTDSLTGDAKAAYESGKLLYQDGDYAGALLKFQQAYEASKDARLLWNMAVCQKNLRRYSKVLGLVKKYQVDAAAVMSESDRTQTQELLTAVQGFVSPVTVKCNEEQADVTIDEEPAGKTPLAAPVIVDMGPRRVKVSKSGFSDFTQTLHVGGNTPVSVDAVLKKELHEGKLVIVAEPKQYIYLDGRIVGEGRWEGVVASGGHMLRITAPGKRTYQSEVTIKDGDKREVRVALENEAPVAAATSGSSNTWLWVAGGAALVAGVVVGGYFALRPKDEGAPPAVGGTIPPYTVPLPFLSWGR
jgi:hypothetical protein